MKSKFFLPNSSTGLTRREMLQRFLTGVGTALAAPMIASAHPVLKHLPQTSTLEVAANAAASDWSPQFLEPHQNDTLIVLAEGIVPEAGKAQVNRIIDGLLTVETTENRAMFKSALAAMDAEATKRFQKNVVQLQPGQLNELLSACSTEPSPHPLQHDDAFAAWKTNQNLPTHAPENLRDHFEILKGWIVATYYSSEQGMRELGWTDEFYFDSLAECPHPEGH